MRQLEVRENKPKAATQITEKKPKPEYRISSRIKQPADPVRNIIAAHVNIRQGMKDEVETGLIIFQLPSFC